MDQHPRQAQGPVQGPVRQVDRWAWRRRLRSDPRTRGPYRVVVGVVGVLLLLLAALTGPLPGPGGIPLALLGLAVLASEFAWARRLLDRATDRLRRGRAWLAEQPRWVSWWSGFASALVLLGAAWLGLSLLGYPAWLPDVAAGLLDRVPGVEQAR